MRLPRAPFLSSIKSEEFIWRNYNIVKEIHFESALVVCRTTELWQITRCVLHFSMWTLPRIYLISGIPLVGLGLSLQLLQFVTYNWISSSSDNPVSQLWNPFSWAIAREVDICFFSILCSWPTVDLISEFVFWLDIHTNVTLNRNLWVVNKEFREKRSRCYLNVLSPEFMSFSMNHSYL